MLKGFQEEGYCRKTETKKTPKPKNVLIGQETGTTGSKLYLTTLIFECRRLVGKVGLALEDQMIVCKCKDMIFLLLQLKSWEAQQSSPWKGIYLLFFPSCSVQQLDLSTG